MKKKKTWKHFDSYGRILNIGDIILLPYSFIGKIIKFDVGDDGRSLIITTGGVVYACDEKTVTTSLFYEVILIPENLEVYNEKETKDFGELFEQIDNKVPDHSLEDDMSTKLYPLIENNFEYLKKYLRNILLSTAGDTTKANLRYEHCLLVAKISDELYDMYIETSHLFILDPVSTLISELNKHDMRWTFELCGYLHDMYKYSKSKKIDHGKIAAKQFSMFCKMYDVEMWDVPMKMKEALTFHSEKNKSFYSNPYFSILCDADILSKYSLSALNEKIARNDWINDLDTALDYTNEACKNYVPKTPYFAKLRENYVSKLMGDVEVIKNAVSGSPVTK